MTAVLDIAAPGLGSANRIEYDPAIARDWNPQADDLPFVPVT